MDETVGYSCSICNAFIKKGEEHYINMRHRGKRVICAECSERINTMFDDKDEEDHHGI